MRVQGGHESSRKAGRRMRGSAVGRAKAERLMNNFAITLLVIWRYFHCNDILGHQKKCHCACLLLIRLWEFGAIVLGSRTALTL